jgi:hypothetical protein
MSIEDRPLCNAIATHGPYIGYRCCNPKERKGLHTITCGKPQGGHEVVFTWRGDEFHVIKERSTEAGHHPRGR